MHSKNQKARFWKYCGNHPNGKNHDRHDPHNFGLDLISYVAYIGDGGDYEPPFTYEHTQNIVVSHHKGDNFGHEITVTAPPEVWQLAKEFYAKMLEACV